MIEINEDRRMEKEPRPIQSTLKSHRIMQEKEKPIRWSYMKILREHSDLKEFYPEIDPYAEAYRMRDNMWAIFTESRDGAGDPWMYLINGPERACQLPDRKQGTDRSQYACPSGSLHGERTV